MASNKVLKENKAIVDHMTGLLHAFLTHALLYRKDRSIENNSRFEKATVEVLKAIANFANNSFEERSENE